MILRSLKYFVKQAFSGLFRNRWMTFASISTVASCVFILAVTFTLVSNVGFFVEQLERSLGITVFMDRELSHSDIMAVGNDIMRLDHVVEIEYVSPEQALLEMEESLGFPMEDLRYDNPLPPAYRITISATEHFDEVTENLRNIRNIARVSTDQAVVARELANFNNVLTIAGVVLFVLLGAMAFTIIMNTIKLSVYVRRNEITVMKYVGATDGFIRWPFIIEGLFIGFVGSIIPLLVCAFSYVGIIEAINTRFPLIEEVGMSFLSAGSVFGILTPVSLLLGLALGAFGSVNSIRKYLDV